MAANVDERHFSYVWEYTVAPEHVAEFERHYGPEGSWAQLFRQAAGYRETLLLKDRSASIRYITVDRWESEAAFQRFKEQFSEQYAELDRRCERLTLAERRLGDYLDFGT